jgi:phosphoribosyl-ATP pyrophosphohydrolase
MSALATVIERVFSTIQDRAGGDPKSSYVAGLRAKGRGAITAKIGEESTEVVIAALSAGDNEVIHESADLLFHMMVLWSDCGITPDDVFNELSRREGISGLNEKAARDS